MNLNPVQIQSIAGYFRDKPVKRAYVFGSYARGDAVENSDIDILVELDYSQEIGLRFFRMKSELEEIVHHDVDIVASDGLSKYIEPLVEREKVLIYER